MNADEIRDNLQTDGKCSTDAQIEIAAQLAELNEKFQRLLDLILKETQREENS